VLAETRGEPIPQEVLMSSLSTRG